MTNSKRRVVVIGGGICGSSAALELARAGNDVTIVERSPALGGLVVSFAVAGTPLECFYHHVFPKEREIIRLISDVGLGSRFELRPSSVGIMRSGRIWPFTGALDLLRFAPLPLRDRVRTGLASLRYAMRSGWSDLDDVSAEDWLLRGTGPRAFEEIWGPLLRFKFGSASGDVPAAWMWARFRQRATARSIRGERLGYLRGGFKQLFDALHSRIESAGGEVRTDSTVQRIAIENDRVTGVVADGAELEADAVLYAGTMPGIGRLVGEDRADPRWNTEGLGAICVVLELKKGLSDTYWTNVCDPDVPFGALIEHTNLVPREDYDGRHIVYLGMYFTSDDPVAREDTAAISKRWVAALEAKLPAFDSRDVIAVNTFRTPYAAPLVTLGYSERIPPIAGDVHGLYVATTAQIYPDDRGMNQGICLGAEASRAISSLHIQKATT